MKPLAVVLIVLVTSASADQIPVGPTYWKTYPRLGVTYTFSFDAGEQDKWDSTKQDAPPLLPGKAARIAKEFVAKVSQDNEFKGWFLETITLKPFWMGLAETWVYVVQFSAVPKAPVWNGPLPEMQVPVRMDGTIPKPLIEGENPQPDASANGRGGHR
jgi:hypothetical protein